MANEQHLELLKQGVVAWNEWKRNYSNTEAFHSRALVKLSHLGSVDLSNISLNGIDLSGMDFSGADFSGIDLSLVNLSGTKLYAADLADADLSRQT